MNKYFVFLSKGIKKPLLFKNKKWFVPRVGIEPTLSKELDFESSASTSSATEALRGQN